MKIKTILACSVAVMALPGIAVAAEERSVSVAAGDAAKSIPELARQESIQIVAPADALRGIQTPAVSGTMNVNQALSDLLAGTGLKVAQNDGKTVVLQRAATAFDMTQALAGQAAAGKAAAAPPTESVTVTGSRVITDIQNSPTPVTIVTAAQLQATTPSDLPDGLNKLPIFQGSNVPRLAGNGAGGNNNAGGVPGNVLNLRNFGFGRTLVLVDGHRAPPTNSDGSVDVDDLPQMLVSRVDVVTGGASAVYGSDAVTGVVNFVLDKKFDGLKIDANGGISTYGDGKSFKVGLAYGTDLFGGRGHFEGSLRHYQQDLVPASARSLGALQITQQGGGSVANPNINVFNTRKLDSPFGGRIAACVPACAAANGMQFVTDGVLGPFTIGAPVGTPASTTVASGGDGGYNKFGTAQSAIRQDELFTRFSYDIDSDTVFYVQTTAAGTHSDGVWFPVKLSPSITAGSGGNGVGIYYKNNPFLSPAVQAALGNNGTNPVQVGAAQPSNTFGLGEYITATGPAGFVGTRNFDRNLSITAGLDGTVFGDFSWDLYYTHGEARQAVVNLNNTNSQNLFAASDAVLSGGQIVCYATTPAAGAAANAAYAGCVPINPFGPTALTPAAENYFAQTTFFHGTNILDDIGAGISGTAFEGWAGPVKVALSAEGRFNQLSVASNASPTATVNCAGLRICTSTSLLWIQNAVAPISASNNVWEVAGEVDAPLIKDVPMIQSLSLNLAGRYTDYSTSGSVQTWKIGADWHVDDSIRLRGTTSIDIRAPTLNDLFAPASSGSTSFSDLYPTFATPPGPATSATTVTFSQGNPNLVPEVARTYTAGIVVTPDFIPGLTASFDYYRIRLKNALAGLSGGNGTGNAATYQTLCFKSGGTSPLCQLFQRPLGNTNTSVANFPTADFSQSINAAFTEIEGWDFETDYGWQMSDVVEGWQGDWTARLLANYQPVNESITVPGVTGQTVSDAPKTHITAFLRYELDDWAIGLEDHWIGGFSKITTPMSPPVYALPHVHSVNYLDLNLERNFELEGGHFTGYFAVQNVINSQSDIYITSSSVGLRYPIPFGQDLMGRFFTVGIRASL